MTAGQPPRRSRAAVAPWRNIRILRVLAQLAVLGVVILVGWLLWTTLVDNIHGTRLTFGLDFLGNRAGFDIPQTPIAYGADDSFARAFVVGVLNTLLVSISGVVLATGLGILIGVARLSRNWLANRISAGYVELMRNTPLLVQLVLILAVIRQLPDVAESIRLPGSVFLNSRGLYLPRPLAEPTIWPWLALIAGALIGAVLLRLLRRGPGERRHLRPGRLGLLAALAVAAVGWIILAPISFDVPEMGRFNFSGGVVLSPAFTALLVGLVMYTAAFIGEVVRGGIQAVRRGQVEAAYAIGLTPNQTLRLIVFPQALRIIVPPLTSQYLNLTKNSSLALAVGYADLFFVGRAISNQSGQTLSVIGLVMATYLSLSLITSLAMNIYNRRVQVLER